MPPPKPKQATPTATSAAQVAPRRARLAATMSACMVARPAVTAARMSSAAAALASLSFSADQGAGIVDQARGRGLRGVMLTGNLTPAGLDLRGQPVRRLVGDIGHERFEVFRKELVNDLRDRDGCQDRIIWRETDVMPPRVGASMRPFRSRPDCVL
jgi:hypothetical protein